MCTIQTPGVDESSTRMHAEAYIGNREVSIAKEAARLCREETRLEGVKSEAKYKKREGHSMNFRQYWVDEGPTEFVNMVKMVQPFGRKENKDNISH